MRGRERREEEETRLQDSDSGTPKLGVLRDVAPEEEPSWFRVGS